MKNLISIIIVFGILLVAIPSVALINKDDNDEKSKTNQNGSNNIKTVKILDIGDNKITELSLRDYVIGAVLSQMPADFEIEALKAQAVIAHTYIVRRRMAEEQNPTENLIGADLSTDTTKYNSCFTKEQAELLYGDNFQENYKKIELAVDDVMDEIITYNNEPIIAAFHSMSGNKTESSEIAWGNSYPYLISVDRVEDVSQTGYTETIDFTFDEFSARLSQSSLKIEFEEDKTKWIENVTTSEAGSVIGLDICGEKVKGEQLRDILSLRSSCFGIDIENDSIKITTNGVGHGVGLSQYGANQLAKEGKNYEEILKYYYSGVKIKNA